MTADEARKILIEAFVANPDLPPDMRALLAKLVVPRKRRSWIKL